MYQSHVGLISGGIYHSAFLSDEGQVYIVGCNELGQLGLEKEEIVLIPKQIPNIPQIKAISCGMHSTICIDIDGNLWGFGENIYGQLALGKHNLIMKPTQIKGLPPIIDVQCGVRHTLCICEDSNLWVFGSNGYYQLFLDRPSKNHKEISPVKTSFSNIINIAAGNACSFAQNSDGEIITCGLNNDGQLGLGIKTTKVKTPALVVNQPPNIVAICCTRTTALLLDEFGSVFCTGTYFSNFFTKLNGLPTIISIACGKSFKCIDEDGKLWIFGTHCFDGTESEFFTTPVLIDRFPFVTHISNGYGQSDFIKDENGLYSTGNNDKGQLGIGSRTMSLCPITKLGDELSHIVGYKIKSMAKSARK